MTENSPAASASKAELMLHLRIAAAYAATCTLVVLQKAYKLYQDESAFLCR